MKQNSRSKKKTAGATNPPNPGDVAGGQATQGEQFGVGVGYTAVLSERENKSLNRNSGPMHPSANTGKIGHVTKGRRKTGKVGG